MSIVFKNGTHLIPAIGRYTGSFTNAQLVLNDFIAKNDVSIEGNGLMALLSVKGKDHIIFYVTYGKLFRAFNIEESDVDLLANHIRAGGQDPIQDVEQIGVSTILAEFKNKIKTVTINSEASEVANSLVINIETALQKYIADADVTAFKKQVKASVDAAAPILERDLTWGDYLINMLKNIFNAVAAVVTFGHVEGFFATKTPDSFTAAAELNNLLQTAEESVAPTIPF